MSGALRNLCSGIDPNLKADEEEIAESSSALRSAVLPPLADGQNLFVHAVSDDDRTETTARSVLQAIDPIQNDIQAIIITELREKAAELHHTLTKLAGGGGVLTHLSVVGVNKHEEVRMLNARVVHVLVGTSVRIAALIRGTDFRLAVRIPRLKLLVVNEPHLFVNEFPRQAVKDILEIIPAAAQLVVFSSEPPDKVERIVPGLTGGLSIVRMGDDLIDVTGVKHYAVTVTAKKIETRVRAFLKLYGEFRASRAVLMCEGSNVVGEASSAAFPFSSLPLDKGLQG